MTVAKDGQIPQKLTQEQPEDYYGENGASEGVGNVKDTGNKPSVADLVSTFRSHMSRQEVMPEMPDKVKKVLGRKNDSEHSSSNSNSYYWKFRPVPSQHLNWSYQNQSYLAVDLWRRQTLHM